MGIFSRLNTVIKSNLNSLVDKAEDPEKLIGQTVIDMKAELKRAKRELVTTLGTSKRLDKEADELEEELGDWERKAVLALKTGDDDLAREALLADASRAVALAVARALGVLARLDPAPRAFPPVLAPARHGHQRCETVVPLTNLGDPDAVRRCTCTTLH